MYLNRLIREDRDRQIEVVSRGKDYSAVEDEISNIEIVAASFSHLFIYPIERNVTVHPLLGPLFS